MGLAQDSNRSQMLQSRIVKYDANLTHLGYEIREYESVIVTAESHIMKKLMSIVLKIFSRVRRTRASCDDNPYLIRMRITTL